MKLAVFLPFVLLLGLIIGGWAPKEDLRAATKELTELKGQLAKRSKDQRVDTFASFVKIPERATRLNPKPPSAGNGPDLPAAGAPSNDAPREAAAGRTVTNTAARSAAAQPETPRSAEDLRARIDEAKELWKTRVEIARAQWLDRLRLSAEDAALFDDTINTMNESLYASMQRMADGLAADKALTPEDGVRVFSEMTSALVQAYDDLNAFLPEAQRGEAANLELTDFVDPAVAEPLIAVQDKLDNMPKGRRPFARPHP